MPLNNDQAVDRYLADLAVTPPLRERVTNLRREYEVLFGHPGEFVFLEDVLTGDGRREFPNIVLLSPNIYAEFAISGPQNAFSMFGLAGNIIAIGMPLRQDLSFDRPQATSRLTVNLTFEDRTTAFFNTTGLNCGELLDATKRYFIPNLRQRR